VNQELESPDFLKLPIHAVNYRVGIAILNFYKIWLAAVEVFKQQTAMAQTSNSPFSDSHRMEQSPSTNGETQHEAPAENPLQVEAYADRLMDDVFADVERVASGSNRLPAEPAQPAPMQLKSVRVPSIVLSPQWEAPPPATTTEDTSSDRSSHAWQLFDRILLASAGTALVLIVGLWLGTRQQVRQFFGIAPTPAPEPTQENATGSAPGVPPSVAEKEEFQEYLRRSLAAIERNQQQQRSPQPQVAQQPAVDPQTMAQVTNNPELASALNRLASAIERSHLQASMPPGGLYPMPMQGSMPPMAQQPSQPVAPPPTPTPAIPPSPTPVASQPAPQTTTPATPPTQQTSPTTSTPAPSPSPSPTPTTATSPQPLDSSEGNHVLVGIMELGDRSAGLFEINGVARRIRIGQTIGSSGWTLVEVKDGEAIIRRNGEVRSIFVGQKF
jgi:hypothetical protein